MRYSAVQISALALLAASCGNRTPDRPDDQDGHFEPGFRPNILWITCEDIGPVMPMYGDSTVETPNLSRLAAEGIVYPNAFSVSGVCSPSRSCLITGMYPVSIGTHNHRSQVHTMEEIPEYEAVPPAHVKCFTEYMRQAGYYCSNRYKTDYNFGGGILKAPVSAFDINRWDADWSGRKPGQPFFSIFNHQITHMFKLYNRSDQPLRVDPGNVPVPPYFPDTRKARTSIARLYDNLMILDRQVGELLQKLEQENLMDSTIIFFFSDHGDGLPRNKIWLYDSGIRVPLIIRFPGQWKAGSRNENPVSFVDFAPTVLSLCRIGLPGHFQGRPFLNAPKDTEPRKYIFAAKDRIDFEQDRIRAVRDNQFKYIRNYYPDRPYIQNFPWSDNIALTREWKRLHAQDSLNKVQSLFFMRTRPEEELYDITEDPYEVRNLASDPAYAEVLERMRTASENHIEKTGDLGFTGEKELIERFWPSGIQPVTPLPEITVSGQKINIDCALPEASIVCKINHTNREWCWKLYDGPFEANPGDTITSRAIRYGYKESGDAVLINPSGTLAFDGGDGVF